MSVTPRSNFISKDDASRPWLATCEESGCKFTVSAKTEELGQRWLDTHKCPSTGGTTVVRKSQYEKIWDELDESMSIIMDKEKPTEDREREKIYAKGLAFSLATFSHVNLDTVEAISKEALARYHMRIGKIDFRPTTGYIFKVTGANMSPSAYAGAHGTDAQRRAAAEAAESRRNAEATSGYSTRTRVHEVPKTMLTDKQQAAIRAGLAGGMSTKDLAALYHVPVQAVEALV